MGAKTFTWAIAAAIAVGAAVGAGAYALTGNDDAPADSASVTFGVAPGVGASESGAQSGAQRGGQRQDGDDDDAQPGGSEANVSESTDETADDDDAPAAGPVGGPPERIAGAVSSIDSSGVVLATEEGPVAVAIAGDTPVQITKTASDVPNGLVVGADVTAVLTRTDTGVVAQLIAIGGLEFAGRGGAGRGGAGGGRANAVTGTIASVDDGALVIDTAEGPVEAALADDTPVSISRTFADAAGDLPEGTEITVIGQRSADGEFQAIAVTTGAVGGGRGAQRGGEGRTPGRTQEDGQ